MSNHKRFLKQQTLKSLVVFRNRFLYIFCQLMKSNGDQCEAMVKMENPIFIVKFHIKLSFAELHCRKRTNPTAFNQFHVWISFKVFLLKITRLSIYTWNYNDLLNYSLSVDYIITWSSCQHASCRKAVIFEWQAYIKIEWFTANNWPCNM